MNEGEALLIAALELKHARALPNPAIMLEGAAWREQVEPCLVHLEYLACDKRRAANNLPLKHATARTKAELQALT